MANFLQGFLPTAQAGIEARNDVTVAIRNWFANRNPLITRLPYIPVDRVDFLMYDHLYRPVSTTLSASLAATTTTQLTLTDNTFLMNHDILEVVDSGGNGSEYVQVNTDPAGSGVVYITRSIGGTTAITASSGSTVYVIGNSRTGSEVSQTGLTSVGTARTQYCQTFQFPVQIGGSAQTTRAQVFPGGIQSPYDFNQTVQLQNMIDSMETACYYGKAQAPLTTNTSQTAVMNGLKWILTTNNIGLATSTTPTNATAYGPGDLVRDTLQAARLNGGEPDLLIVGPDWMTAFSLWGQAVMRIPAGETVFGTPIDAYEAPFLHGVTIVEAPLLRAGTAIALTSSEVYIRVKRQPYWNQRGNRGDMVEGDWIAEAAIEVVNQAHHSWLDSVTGFAAA